MFDYSLVVQSAVSSFNNAAVVAPTFFWSAVFMLPLFALVYVYGNKFIDESKFSGFNTPKNKINSFAFFTELTILSWLILMHGNFDVLRDSVSYLPYIIAGLVFVLTASVIRKLREINPKMPVIWHKITKNKYIATALFILLSAAVGFSGMQTWFGVLLQGSAFASGAIIGYYWSKKDLNPINMTTIIMFVLTSIILMQPEFFRFGQLGNLTLIHLFFVVLTGALAAAIIAMQIVNSRGKIKQGAFNKLKWMARIVIAISLMLLVFTESVPVFLGLVFVLFVSFAMSIWHRSDSIPEYLPKKLWALLLCSFGIITSLPIITSFGILYWLGLPKSDTFDKSKFLL